MASRGYLTAMVLGFAHTLGEFGVVLMVGGNIPGKTKVLSIAIYDHVEVLEYAQAHVLSAGLLLFSFLVLLLGGWVAFSTFQFLFQNEIIPVEVPQADGSTIIFIATDCTRPAERPRRTLSQSSGECL